MTVQLQNAEQFELLRSRFQDKGAPGAFAYNQIIPFVDFPLFDADVGSHFNDNDSSYPAGWTEVDASFATNTNSLYGFWFLSGSGGSDRDWKYRKQTGFNIEADSADGDWISFEWGPVFYRDGVQPNDLDYTFGIYADNAGSINEDQFIRARLHWDATTAKWQIRGERKDGTTQTNGSYFDLAQYPPIQPIYIRNVLRYFAANTNERVRSYIGSSPIRGIHSQLMNDFMNLTWGNVWAQATMSRGIGGIQDYIFIGGFDRSNEP